MRSSVLPCGTHDQAPQIAVALSRANGVSVSTTFALTASVWQKVGMFFMASWTPCAYQPRPSFARSQAQLTLARLWFGLLWSVKLCCESQDHRCHLLLYNSAKLQLHSFLVFRQQSSCLEFSRQHQQNETIKELFEEWQEKYDLILGLPLSYICILDANKTTNYGRPEPWNNTRKAFSFQTALSKSLHSTHTIHTFSLRIVYPSTFAAGSLFSLLLTTKRHSCNSKPLYLRHILFLFAVGQAQPAPKTSRVIFSCRRLFHNYAPASMRFHAHAILLQVGGWQALACLNPAMHKASDAGHIGPHGMRRCLSFSYRGRRHVPPTRPQRPKNGSFLKSVRCA